MSVNVYDKDTGELTPLTSAFSTLAIVDVADLPSSNILDVIYRVTAETYGFHSVEIYDDDMATNTSNLEAIGFSTSTSGDNYIYTPSTKKIRYLYGNSVDYEVKYVVINSVDKTIQIYNIADSLLLDAVIASGAGYPFYNANYWTEESVTLSNSDMDANTTALTALGFAARTDNTTWEYTPNEVRFRYDENLPANEVTKMTISAGVLTIYNGDTVVDTVTLSSSTSVTLWTTAALSFWIGCSSDQSLERIATYGSGGGGSSNVHSLQDIFAEGPDQEVVGTNTLTMEDTNKETYIAPDSVKVTRTSSGTDRIVSAGNGTFNISHKTGSTTSTDFNLDHSEVVMNDALKKSFRLVLNIDDIYYDITEHVEDDYTSSANAYAVDDIVLVKSVPTGIPSRPTVDLLYRVIEPISVGDAFTDSGVTPNVVHITVEDMYDLKQNITLLTPLKIDSATINATTVEGALGKLNEKKIDVSKIGAASGVAELGSDGKVPAAQLPAYVDDVVEAYYNSTDGKFYEEATFVTEITPQAGKVYIDKPTNKTYRWSGSMYAPISGDLALGETSSTAYRGDRGKAAYDLSIENSDRIDTLDVNLAIVETDPVTNAHTVGEFFVFEDALYRVIADMSAGDAIDLNVNVLRVDMTDVIEEINETKVYYTNVAPAFDPLAAYAVKDVVVKGTTIYQFTSAHTAGDPWDASEVTAVTVNDLIANATPNSLSSADIAALKALLD